MVEPYRVAPLIDLEENSIFCVFDKSLINVDTEELNVVLSSIGKANVDEDDDDIHIEDCAEGDDYSIDDEEVESIANYGAELNPIKNLFAPNKIYDKKIL